MLLHMPERPPRLTPIPKSGANMGNQGWTYVGEMRMREYQGKFGKVLCDLVSDCCKHMPADRPSLTQLWQRVDAALNVRVNQMDNNSTNFVGRTLHDPAQPNPEPGTVGAGLVVNFPW